MSNEELQLISELRGGLRLMGKDSAADDTLLAADGGKRLDGRDLWIHRQTHMMAGQDEEQQASDADEAGLTGRDLFVYRQGHMLPQPDPEKVNQRYQQHIEKIRAINARRQAKGEHVIPNIISQDRDVDSEIGSLTGYRVYYEDLFDDEGMISASLIEELAKAVDIDPGTVCRIPISRRQNTIPIADVIDNVDAVYDALSRRSLQWMLST